MKSIYTTLFLASLLLTLNGCSNNENEERDNRRGQGYIPTVEVIQTVTGALPLEERMTGVVRARNQVDIYPEITAPVTEVLVQSGQRVEQGQPLVKLRDREFSERLRQAESGLEIAEAQVRQAQASLNRVRARLSRVEALSVRNLESELELETIQAEVEEAEASLELQRAQRNQAASVVEERKNELDNTIIKSPVNGFVGTVNVQPGQTVNSGTVLFQVGDTSHMQVRISLTERMLGYIEEGQTVQIFTGALGDTPVETTLTRISPFLNPQTNATDAEIEVENLDNRLRSGMFVTVDILYGESEQAVLIPNNALYNHPNDGRRGVYVAEASGLQELDFEGDERPEIMGPVPVAFRDVDIVAQGRQVSGVRGIDSGDYVITLGQNLVASGREEARIRVIEWDRMIQLQELQSRDLLQLIREKLANQNGDTDDA